MTLVFYISSEGLHRNVSPYMQYVCGTLKSKKKRLFYAYYKANIMALFRTKRTLGNRQNKNNEIVSKLFKRTFFKKFFCNCKATCQCT